MRFAQDTPGAMLDQIIKGGFKVVALKYTRLTKADAEQFYAIHAERPFTES